jgi:hypothetical protein
MSPLRGQPLAVQQCRPGRDWWGPYAMENSETGGITARRPRQAYDLFASRLDARLLEDRMYFLDS